MLYKLNDTEAYVESGSGQGGRETVPPRTAVHEWGKPVLLHIAPTEVERAALTLLMGCSLEYGPFAEHPGLYHWIRALAADPKEMRDLDRFIWEMQIPSEWMEMDGRPEVVATEPLRAVCIRRGYVCWQREYDQASAWKAIVDENPQGLRLKAQAAEGREAGGCHWRDKNLLFLAYAVAKYRIAGRPDGDQTSTIYGLGGPLLSVSTSLAAAIAEFHYNEINRIYYETRGA